MFVQRLFPSRQNARKIAWLLAFSSLPLLSFGKGKPAETSIEESMELKRIAEYWKEKEFSTVKLEIADFLSKNPQSPFCDHLHAMLGDIHFQEKQYEDALAAYDKIEGREFSQKCKLQKLQALYETQNFERLISLSSSLLKDPLMGSAEVNAIRYALAESRFQLAFLTETTEKKKALYREALSDYLQLHHTKYADKTFLPLAQIYAILEDFPKAASAYLHLADIDPQTREENLFLAASYQLQSNPKEAIQTFGHVYALGGPNAGKAALNQLNLLFQEKDYRGFVLSVEKAIKHIPRDALGPIQYALGKSLLHIEDYTQAVAPLLQALASKGIETAQQKSALLSLVVCAKQTADLPLFEKTVAELKQHFPKDEETANALLMHAELCCEKKQWEKVHAHTQVLSEHWPEHQQLQSLLYDDALAYEQEGRWTESAQAFERLLNKFSACTQQSSALRHLVHCRMQDATLASRETEKVKRELLTEALQRALNEDRALSAKEAKKMRFALAKTQFDNFQFEAAMGTLSEYVKDFPKDPTAADAHLMLAFCYKNGETDEMRYALNVEKAMQLNPNLPNATDLHLSLFNAYLGLAAKAEEGAKGEMMQKAAEHLYVSFDRSDSMANKRWLANYYYTQSKKGVSGAIEMAGNVLEKFLGLDSKGFHLSIDADSMELEAEAIRLCEVYEITKRSKERTQLLEALAQEQKNHPELPWKYQRMALFELAKAHAQLKNNETAMRILDELIDSAPHATSYFGTAAEMQRAKLRFQMLPVDEKIEDSIAVRKICDSLKDLQIKRRLHSEPLHLEAALSYIDIKTELAPSDKKEERALHLLEQMKENFISGEDPAVTQYLSASVQFPEKKQLLSQYMDFVDLEMQRLHAHRANNTSELKEIAKQFEMLHAQAGHEWLKSRIQQSIKSLEQTR